MIQRPIAGDLNLDELVLECGTIQNVAFCKLIHLEKMGEVGGTKFNFGAFAEVKIGNVPLPTFITIDAEDNVASIIADQLAQSKLLIFDEDIFVEGKITRVLGFR
jgi:hypothetical protein